MNDRQRAKVAEDVAELLAKAADALNRRIDGKTLIDRMREYQPGPKAQSFEARSVNTVSDPTAKAVGSGVTDRASSHLVELDALIARIAKDARRLGALVKAYPPASIATRQLREQTSGLDAGCASCARTTDGAGLPRWEPIKSDSQHGPTTVGNRLVEPMALCAWCYKRVVAWNRLPTIEELERHHRGERVPWPRDVPRPA